MTDQKIPGVSSNASRTWMTSLIGLLVVLVIYLATPTQHFSPVGIILPAAHTLPASSPSDVKLLGSLPSGATLPSGAKYLGAIHIEMQFTGNKNSTGMEIRHKVQLLAASVGGNAVFVQLFGFPSESSGLPSNMIYWNFHGIVYKIDPSWIPMEPSIVMPTQ